MSLLLALLAWALPQEEAGMPPAPQVALSWWEQLPPEQRERMHERWRKYRAYGAESQESLRQRFEAIERERTLLVRRLSDEERRRFEGLDDPGRRQFLDQQLRERFHERAERWRGRAPGLADGLRDLPPDECSRRLKRLTLEAQAEFAKRALGAAVEEGWIGPSAADWLRQAPAEELVSAVGQVQRWRFLERAHREGLWERLGVGPEERLRMLELPIPHFFEEVRRLERGESPLGPPRDWRRDGLRHGFGAEERGPKGGEERGERHPPPPPPPDER